VANDVKVKAFPIMLDKERTICYDLNAFVALEGKFGSLQETVNALNVKSIGVLRTFLWAGLLHEDETLTEKDVGKLLTVQNMVEFSETLLTAVSESLPTAKN